MKSLFNLFVFLTLFSPLNGQQDVTISGTALAADRQVSLQAFDPDSMGYVTLETLSLAEARTFQFVTPFNGANLYRLQFDGEKAVRLSVEAPARIAVERTADHFLVEGSPGTLRMLAFPEENEALQAKHFAALKTEIDEAMAAGDQEKLAELQKKADIALQAFLIEFRAAITDLGPTPAGYYALQFSDFNKEIDFIEGRLAEFQKAIPGSPVTRALEKQVGQAKATAVGNRPPEFQAADKNGRSLTLADFKGKILLVDFWAAWCRACRIENPGFVKLYDRYHPSGFEIISISQDRTETAWTAAIEKDGTGAWYHIWDQDNRISDLYAVSSLPQNVLLDKAGRVVAKNLDAEALERALAALLERR